MSPTSYQAAPPRIRSVAEQRRGVKSYEKSLRGEARPQARRGYLLPTELPALGAAAWGSLISIAQRGKA